jgi:hypothetical protein
VPTQTPSATPMPTLAPTVTITDGQSLNGYRWVSVRDLTQHKNERPHPTRGCRSETSPNINEEISPNMKMGELPQHENGRPHPT